MNVSREKDNSIRELCRAITIGRKKGQKESENNQSAFAEISRPSDQLNPIKSFLETGYFEKRRREQQWTLTGKPARVSLVFQPSSIKVPPRDPRRPFFARQTMMSSRHFDECSPFRHLASP